MQETYYDYLIRTTLKYPKTFWNSFTTIAIAQEHKRLTQSFLRSHRRSQITRMWHPQNMVLANKYLFILFPYKYTSVDDILEAHKGSELFSITKSEAVSLLNRQTNPSKTDVIIQRTLIEILNDIQPEWVQAFPQLFNNFYGLNVFFQVLKAEYWGPLLRENNIKWLRAHPEVVRKYFEGGQRSLIFDWDEYEQKYGIDPFEQDEDRKPYIKELPDGRLKIKLPQFHSYKGLLTALVNCKYSPIYKRILPVDLKLSTTNIKHRAVSHTRVNKEKKWVEANPNVQLEYIDQAKRLYDHYQKFGHNGISPEITIHPPQELDITKITSILDKLAVKELVKHAKTVSKR